MVHVFHAAQVHFNVSDPAFQLDDLLALQLHKFEEEVGEIVDRAQKEEKMEQGLARLEDAWGKVEFHFNKHKDTDVYTVKMAEEDFEVTGALRHACLNMWIVTIIRRNAHFNKCAWSCFLCVFLA